MNVLSLFDGISCGQIVFKNLNIKVDNYFASEIDNKAIQVCLKNFPQTIQLGDVRKLSYKNNKLYKDEEIVFEGTIDILIGGSPCQGFSFAGKQLNFEDERSKLFFEYVRLLKEIKPKYFLLENNPMKKEFEIIISNFLEVESIVINSSLLTTQNRKRLYWTNIKNVEKSSDLEKKLSEIIGDYEGIWVYPRGYNKGGLQGYKGKCPTITTSNWQHNFLIVKDNIKRKFTACECELIQTLPLNYTNVNLSENQRIKLIGNCWSVKTIEHIFKNFSFL